MLLFKRMLLSNGYKQKFCQHHFEDENFVDNLLTTKTSKFTSLENLYIYGILVKIVVVKQRLLG